MGLLKEEFSKVVIDESDPLLYQLVKEEANDNFEGRTTEMLILMLLERKKMLRFTHDFKHDIIYVDFPEQR